MTKTTDETEQTPAGVSLLGLLAKAVAFGGLFILSVFGILSVGGQVFGLSFLTDMTKAELFGLAIIIGAVFSARWAWFGKTA